MLLLTIKVAAVIACALVMAMSLAHALELPGKLRLNREQYLAIQPIYYPGFTIGGASEPIAILLLAALLFLIPAYSARFWLVAGAFVGMILVQVIFWTMTAPANRYWVAGVKTTPAAQQFFGSVDPGRPTPEWTTLRDRWERSHLLRSIAATIGFVLLVVAVAL